MLALSDITYVSQVLTCNIKSSFIEGYFSWSFVIWLNTKTCPGNVLVLNPSIKLTWIDTANVIITLNAVEKSIFYLTFNFSYLSL